MSKKYPDIDRLQYVKDAFLTPNRYKLDCRFVLRDGKQHPFALICPGGGYQKVCSFIEGTPIARRLNAMGISAFILHYRVREKARYPAPMDALARAVKEILGRAEHFHVDTAGYSVWGSSAGGHLAASFGTEHMGYRKYGLPKPGALVLSYPVITMGKELTHFSSHNCLLRTDADDAREELTSVERHVTADYPSTYVWCGDADQTVSSENTKLLAAALKSAGVPMECEIFPGVAHGVGPGTGTAAEGWIEKAVKFWRSQ